jgi:hypothetical protein
LIPGVFSGNGDAAAPAAQWRSLCERFYEIRSAAYRHNLVDAWHQLVQADPEAPDKLAAWQRLAGQIKLLDERESACVVRGGPEDDSTAIDDWDGWGDEYVCPVHKCDRRERSFVDTPPRCELFHTAMILPPASEV